MTKYLSVEDRLAVWASQGPYRITDEQITFIAAMRIARTSGVGYGWMRQIIGWEWEHATPGQGITDDVVFALGRQSGEASCVGLAARIRKELQPLLLYVDRSDTQQSLAIENMEARLAIRRLFALCESLDAEDVEVDK